MPRLDAERVALWRLFCTTANDVQRRVDEQLVAEHDLPLTWFEVLSALRESPLRVRDLCDRLDEVASSLSRRLDRMVADELVRRERSALPDDKRVVIVSITAAGRLAWREANVTYRRAVQHEFAHSLTETDISALLRVLGKADG